MATYCQVSDIVAIAPMVVINAQSRPSDGQVVSLIADSERDVTAMLANLGYVTPVAEATPKAQVKDLVAHHVLAKILRARAFGSGNEVDLKAAAAAQKYVDDRFAALGDPTDAFELVGAARTDKQVEKSVADVVRSFTEDPDLHIDIDHPVMTIDQVF
jgi:hypothetical protein